MSTAGVAPAPVLPRAGLETLEVFRATDDVTFSKGSKEGVLGPNNIRAWRHTSSRVRLVRFCAPGPIVSVTIYVGTEPVGNGGEPHTLEHIIFLGSRRHPERGYLDTLACHCLGEGTNAYTANEYTCYQATCAGAEGMKSVLPAFVDHVLNPTRTADPSAFASEVYHLRADGTEGGVVFSEMKARESTESDKLDRELRLALLGDTPLQFEAGGLCDSIRELSEDRIHQYHQRFYCGANVSIVVGGSASIPDQVLLDAIVPVLDEYAASPGFNPGSPAWQEPLVPRPMTRELERRTVRFPCVDTSVGSVALGWRAPPARESFLLAALEILLDYLSRFETSPLTQKFVMAEDPLASDISHEIETYMDVSTISLQFAGVEHFEWDDEDDEDCFSDVEDTSENGSVKADDEALSDGDDSRNDPDEESAELLESSPALDGLGRNDSDDNSDGRRESFLASQSLGTIVVEFLASIVRSGKLPGGLETVHTAIERNAEEFLCEMESDPHNVIPNTFVDELVYDERKGVAIGAECRGYLQLLERLRQEGESFWLDLIDTAIVKSRRVEIYMMPDSSLAHALEIQDEAVVLERVKSTSEEQKSVLQGKVESFMKSLKPAEFAELALPPLPSTEQLPRLPYSVLSSPPGPYFSQLVSVDSGLISATVLFSTASLSFDQRVFLPILQDLLLSMDLVLDDGKRVPFSESSKAITEATVGTDQSGVWLEKPVAMGTKCMGVNYSATADRFDEATFLVLRAIFHGKPTWARLANTVRNMDSDIVEGLRDAEIVQSIAARTLPVLFGDHPLGDAELISAFCQAPLLSSLGSSSTSPRVQRRVLSLLSSTLENLREQPPENVFVQIGGRDPGRALEIFDLRWSACWRPEHSVGVSSHQPHRSPVLHHPSRSIADLIGNEEELAYCMGVDGSQTVHVGVSVDCHVDRGHVDWAPLRVLTEMLSRAEGPLYNAVRGAGLAYNVSLSLNEWEAKLTLSVSEASHPSTSWDAVCATLDQFRANLDGDETATRKAQSEVSTAKSSILYYQVSSKATPQATIGSAFSGAVLDVPSGEVADRTMEERIESVDVSSVRAVFDEYILALLQEKTRLSTLTCSPGRAEEMAEAFRGCHSPISFKVVKLDYRNYEFPQVVNFCRTLFS